MDKEKPEDKEELTGIEFDPAGLNFEFSGRRKSERRDPITRRQSLTRRTREIRRKAGPRSKADLERYPHYYKDLEEKQKEGKFHPHFRGRRNGVITRRKNESVVPSPVFGIEKAKEAPRKIVPITKEVKPQAIQCKGCKNKFPSKTLFLKHSCPTIDALREKVKKNGHNKS